MKKLALALLLLQPFALFAATKNTNPADFTIIVHVISCATTPQGLQVLETVIDNQPIQLRTDNGALLMPGDYKARVSTSVHGPKNAHGYDIYRGYDLLMADGTPRTYAVTRLGPSATNP